MRKYKVAAIPNTLRNMRITFKQFVAVAKASSFK
jgi:hypothetical protein